MKPDDSSEKYAAVVVMLEHAVEVRSKLDQLHNAIPMDDYYRLRQLLDEAVVILKKLQL